MDLSWIPKWLMRIAILGWVTSFLFIYRLPPPELILPELATAPIQYNNAASKEFEISYKDEITKVKTLDDYELWGLVVSHNDPAIWYRFDITHDDKSIDTRDFCVIWGKNLSEVNYRKVSYYNNDWSCVYSYKYKDVSKFNDDELSNNHLITDSAAIRKTIANVSVGDQIHLKGNLVSYSEQRPGGGVRTSSTVRTDTLNGACETIFVESLEILNSYNYIWIMLHLVCFWVATGLMLLRIILFFTMA